MILSRLVPNLILLAYALPVALLSGCTDGGEQEVRQWMDDTRRQTRVLIPKLAEPKTFTPFNYAEKSAVDPFSAMKLQVALSRQLSSAPNKFKPNFERRREALESYPLDSMKMVGTMQTKDMKFALIEVDKLIYQVKIGSYMGQNFGMVTRISDSDMELKEVMQDPGGDWVERKAKLELQESKK